jgi:hypothetical protein
VAKWRSCRGLTGNLKDRTMNRIARIFAPLVAAVAAAVACTAVSVALLGSAPAQASASGPLPSGFAFKALASLR